MVHVFLAGRHGHCKLAHPATLTAGSPLHLHLQAAWPSLPVAHFRVLGQATPQAGGRDDIPRPGLVLHAPKGPERPVRITLDACFLLKCFSVYQKKVTLFYQKKTTPRAQEGPSYGLYPRKLAPRYRWLAAF